MVGSVGRESNGGAIDRVGKVGSVAVVGRLGIVGSVSRIGRVGREGKEGRAGKISGKFPVWSFIEPCLLVTNCKPDNSP